MKARPWTLTILASAVSAGGVWALSVPVTGYKEPWDAPGAYYPVALAVAGLISGLVSPRVVWAFPLGAILGQLLYEVAFLEMGPLVLVGVLFMSFYLPIFLPAALFSSYVRGRAMSRRLRS